MGGTLHINLQQIAPEPAMTTREKSDWIMCHLFYRPQTTNDLADLTGFDRLEVSRLIHDLKKHNYIVSREVRDTRNGETTMKHELTEKGIDIAPDPARFFAKHKPFAGLRHMDGVAGKFNPSKPLKGVRAKLYSACKREMDAHELSAAANIDLNTTFTQLSLMTKLGIFQAIERPNTGAGKKRTRLHYVRKMRCIITDEAEPEPPVTTAAQQPNPPQPSQRSEESTDKNEAAATTRRPTALATEIDRLLAVYSGSEILLDVILRMQDRIDELQAFRDSIIKEASRAR